MATITIERDGYGYVEPNFLSAPRTGQVRADLPVSEAALEKIAASEDGALMNGMFVQRHGDFEGAKQGYVKTNCVDFGDLEDTGIWWLVFNEEKLYDERYQMHKHFALKPEQFYDGMVVPRLLLPLIGDTFTTNCFAQGTELCDGWEEGEKATILGPDENGMLVEDADGFLQVVRCYTMPDGQVGAKLRVIKNQ